MKPLNAQERTTGLLKFAGLFTFTVVLILIAVYFDLAAVPKKELDYYQKQCKSLQDSIASDAKFNAVLIDLNNNLIQYQSNPNNIVASNAVAGGITSLTEYAKKDSVSYFGKMSAQILTGYGIAVNSLLKLKDNGSTTDDLKKLKDDLKECKDNLKDRDQQITNLNTELAIYRNKK